jgi:glycyl-tRNA synthetase
MQRSSFQEIILKLQNYWAERGCLIWQPYYTQVGAGTMNPATFLRVLGPEPWNVAYVEPSVRPDDGRYGQNPNRFQVHYQFQVILKPDPGDPQELYLDSLKALGIDPRQHDIRFVEDNWEQPVISAWGLGWEVWLDGQEITQFTYFQQVGGQTLDPVAVELTYGLERILIALNNADAIWGEEWAPGVTYGEVRRQEEFEHSKYYFEVADVESMREVFERFERECNACLEQGLVLPAHDYVLKCSHVFNTLDTRGAIGVTERQGYFRRMRELARRVAVAYLEQRQELEYPLLKVEGSKVEKSLQVPQLPDLKPSNFLLEIGVEEMPHSDVNTAISQLGTLIPKTLEENRLSHHGIKVYGTPRRLIVLVKNLAGRQEDIEFEIKGPPASLAYDDSGNPTGTAQGFWRSTGTSIESSFTKSIGSGEYLFARKSETGRSVIEVLKTILPDLISSIKFEKTMKWNDTGVLFSRPIRWFVAMFGETVIPFEYAGVTSGNVTHGLRPYDSPEIRISSAASRHHHRGSRTQGPDR